MKKTLSLFWAMVVVLSMITIPVSASQKSYYAYDAFELKNGSTPWSFQHATIGKDDYQDLAFIESGWFSEFYQNWAPGSFPYGFENNGKRVVAHAGLKGDAVLTFTAPNSGKIKIPSFTLYKTSEGGDGVRIKLTHNNDTLFPEEDEWYEPETIAFEEKLPDILLSVKKGDRICLRINQKENQNNDVVGTVNYRIEYLSFSNEEEAESENTVENVEKADEEKPSVEESIEQESSPSMSKQGAVTTIVENKVKYAGLSNFETVRLYNNLFKDVPSSAWYAEGVKKAYELGLVSGNSMTEFNPNGNMTAAEAIVLVVRINSIYWGGDVTFGQGNPWYQPYVDYAISKGIIYNGQFTNYDEPINRVGFALLLANALPPKELSKINFVSEIPDVPVGEWYADTIYRLYNAGIFTGNDKYGTFNPYSNIQRSEVATIVTRMAIEKERREFVLQKKPPEIIRIDLDDEWNTVSVGSKAKIDAFAAYDNGKYSTWPLEDEVNWTSSNISIATVSKKGYVEGISTGSVIITAVAPNGVSASKTIYVKLQPYPHTPIPDYTVVTGASLIKREVKTTSSGHQLFSYRYPITKRGGKYDCDYYVEYLKKDGFLFVKQYEEGNKIVWGLKRGSWVVLVMADLGLQEIWVTYQI